MTVETMEKACIALSTTTIIAGHVAKRTGNPVAATITLVAYLAQIPVIASAIVDLNKSMK